MTKIIAISAVVREEVHRVVRRDMMGVLMHELCETR